MKTKLKAFSLALAFVAPNLIAFPATAADDVPLFLPGNAKVPYQLNHCLLPAQLDCIESVAAVKDGVTSQASFVEFRDRADFIDYNGNKRLNDTTIWSLPGELAKDLIEIDAELFPLKHSWPEPDGSRHYAASLMIRIHGNESDLQTKFVVKVRTSWLVPQSVTVAPRDPEFRQERIKGGNLWTLGGVRLATYNYNGDFEKKLSQNANADTADMNLEFMIYHASKNPEEGFFGNRCFKSGYLVSASNAPSGGNAYFNYTTRSLDFNIKAPHKAIDGSPNKGFFYLWVNKEYMKCMWPNSGLDKANRFAVGVYNENGTKQVATTTASYKKGQLKVAAVNFHYSSPTIRLKAKK